MTPRRWFALLAVLAAAVALCHAATPDAVAQQAPATEADAIDAMTAEGLRRAEKKDWPGAIAAAQNAADLARARREKDPERYAVALNALGYIYRHSGQADRAVKEYREALSIRERIADGSRDLAFALNNLGLALQDVGQFAEAEQRICASLKIRERLGNDADIAIALNNLGDLYRMQMRLDEAERVLERSLNIRRRAEKTNPAAVGTAEHNLALLYQAQGKYALAEQAYKRAIRIRELPSADPTLLATSLGSLAVLYRLQGRNEEAALLHERVRELLETNLPSGHPDIATAANNYGSFELSQGHLERAEEKFEAALKIRRKIGNGSAVATTLINLASVRSRQKRFPEAMEPLDEANRLLVTLFGPDSLPVGMVLNQLGGLEFDRGNRPRAIAMFEKALSIRESLLPADHPLSIQSLVNLGAMYFLEEDWSRAVDTLRRAAKAGISRSKRGGNPVAAGPDDTEQDDLVLRDRSFGLLIQALKHLEERQGDKAQLADESFRLGQWMQHSAAAASLSRATARLMPDDPALAETIRERQDLALEWQAKDAILTRSVAQREDRRNAALEREYRERLAAIEPRVDEIDGKLAADLPAYAAMANPSPLGIEDVQRKLEPDEALVMVSSADDFRSIRGESSIWVVTRKDARWRHVEVSRAALSLAVRTLRCGLDKTGWKGFPGDCPHLTGKRFDGGLPPFDFGLAHRLYRDLLEQFEDMTDGKHLLIVSSGPLASLPVQVLLTKAPAGTGSQEPADFIDAAWLGRRQPITVLPSVASLAERTAQASANRKAYLAYGDPVLEGKNDCTPKATLTSCTSLNMSDAERKARAGLGANSAIGLDAIYLPGADQQARLDAVRNQCPLPDSAVEVRCVGESVAASPDDRRIRLGPDATEADIRDLNAKGRLADYRIVHFATHGLLAGAVATMMQREGEPALVMTPPSKPLGDWDDGLLTASEIVRLKFNADWVILSACDTAAGDYLGSEALSGLARAFFYAGARTLMVSHWRVDSVAAAQLMGRMFSALHDHPEIGRAESFRRALVALMQDNSWKWNAHPAIWAPFVIVGPGDLPTRRPRTP